MDSSNQMSTKSEDCLEHGLLSSLNAIDPVSSLSASTDFNDPLDALIDHAYGSHFQPERDLDEGDVVGEKTEVTPVNQPIQPPIVIPLNLESCSVANVPILLSEPAVSTTMPKVPLLHEISNIARFEGVLPATQGHPSPSGASASSGHTYEPSSNMYGQNGQSSIYSTSQPTTARSDLMQLQQSPLSARVSVAPTIYPEDLSTLSIHEFYGIFWELAFKLFANVCSPYISCHDCLTIVEDLIALVHKWGQLRSPSLIVALDVVIQRAMYELSDKMCKIRPRGEESDLAERMVTTTEDSMRNIEECVGIMSNFALPLCWNIQNEFNLGFLAEGSHTLGCKMQTLNRQLQELVSWTSMVGQSKVPATFIDENKTNPAEFGGVMRLDSPRSQATLEMLDHTLLSLLVENVGNQNVSQELMESIQSTLSGLVSRQMGVMVDIQPCGAYALGTIFSDNGPELDYVAITANTLSQVTNWKKLEEGNNSVPNTSRGSTCRQYESVVEMDLLAEGAIKHVKACVKDFLSATGETLHALRSYLATSGRHDYHQYGQNPQQHQHQQYMYMLNELIEEDMNTIRMAGDYFLEKFETTKLARMRNYPALPMIISKIELLQDSMDKDDKEKNAYLRKLAKSLEKPVRDVGFANVRCMTTRARFIHLSFMTYDTRQRHNVPCTLVLDNELPMQGTLLLREYMRFDRSGKIRGFFTIVKKFVKSHNIADVNNGFLSMFAWYMMALHVLLKFNYIPNIHQHGLSLDESPYASEYAAFASSKLSTTYLMELLDRFFRYYVEEFDTFTGVVSIQKQGEVLHKMHWQKTPVLWRISVEDPFAPLHSRNGYDLGTTLSRPGQLTTFKALRRAVYGIRSIVAMGMDSTRTNMKKFFSRAELIHLARRSDYIGATITPPRTWHRRAVPAMLFSLKTLQEPLNNEKLQIMSQVSSMEENNGNVGVSMLSPRDSMLRSTAAPFPMPMGMAGGSNTGMYSARKEESYDPRYQGFTPRSAPNNNGGMNMGSFIDQAPHPGYSSRYPGNGEVPGYSPSPSPRSNYGGNLPPRSMPSGGYNGSNAMSGVNAAMYATTGKDMHPRNNNGSFRTSPSVDSFNSGNYPPAPGGRSGGFPPNPNSGMELGKRPIVPPIPLQGLHGHTGNGMPSSQMEGSWSQRSTLTGGNNSNNSSGVWPSEATFVDRYSNNHHHNNSLASTARSEFNGSGISASSYYQTRNNNNNNNNVGSASGNKLLGESNVSPMLTARSAETEVFADYFNNNNHNHNYRSNTSSANSSFYSNNAEGFGFDAVSGGAQPYSARSSQQVMSARSNYSTHGNSFREPPSVGRGNTGGNSGSGWDINNDAVSKSWPANNGNTAVFDLREGPSKSSLLGASGSNSNNNTAPNTNESLYDMSSPQSSWLAGTGNNNSNSSNTGNSKFWSTASDFSVLEGPTSSSASAGGAGQHSNRYY